MTAALIGYLAIFSVESTDSPGDYIELGEITDVTPPNAQVEQIDATHMQSPNRVREFIAGLTDFGDMSVGMNYIPSSATDDLILAWRTAGTTRSCRITYPSGSSPAPYDTFPGFITGYAPTIAIGEKMSATLTVKVAGAVVRTN